MGNYTFDLSFWIKHPDADLSEIPSRLGMTSRQLWERGDIRMSPSGRNLSGHRGESYCCIEFARGGADLPSELAIAIERLRPHTEYLAQLHKQGVALSFFVGWYSDRNSRDILDWKILNDLAALHISLDLDFYGPDSAEPPA